MEWGSRLREGRKGTFSIPTGGNYGGKEEGEEGEEEEQGEEKGPLEEEGVQEEVVTTLVGSDPQLLGT